MICINVVITASLSQESVRVLLMISFAGTGVGIEVKREAHTPDKHRHRALAYGVLARAMPVSPILSHRTWDTEHRQAKRAGYWIGATA